MPAGHPVIVPAPSPHYPIVTATEAAQFEADLVKAATSLKEILGRKVTGWTRLTYPWVDSDGEILDFREIIFVLDGGELEDPELFEAAAVELLKARLEQDWTEVRFTGDATPRGYLAARMWAINPTFVDMPDNSMVA